MHNSDAPEVEKNVRNGRHTVWSVLAQLLRN
jgi:hypothetical protein